MRTLTAGGARGMGSALVPRTCWEGRQRTLLLTTALLLSAGCAGSTTRPEQLRLGDSPRTPTASADAARGAATAVPRDECIPWGDAIWSGITVLDFEPKPASECLERSADGWYTVHPNVLGHVVSTRGTVLPDATVDVLATYRGGLGEGPPSFSDFGPGREGATSDAQGRFAVKSFDARSDTPPDTYVLTVTKPGYEEEQVLFRCGALTVLVRLQPTCMSQRK